MGGERNGLQTQKREKRDGKQEQAAEESGRFEVEEKKGAAEEGGIWRGKEAPRGRERKRVEKVGGEEKCGKERVKSRGNRSCCPFLQVGDEFLLLGFPDARRSASPFNPCVFPSGGLSSIPVWIDGIEGERGEQTHTCVYLFEDGLSVFRSDADVSWEREVQRKGHFVVTRGGIFVGKLQRIAFVTEEM